jgi:hypothetical protein
MAMWACVPPVLVEVPWFLCTSSVSVDSLVYQIGMEGSQLYDFCQPLPGVFPLLTSPSCAQDTQLLASSLLTQRRKAS